MSMVTSCRASHAASCHDLVKIGFLPRIYPLMDAWAYSIVLAHLSFTTVSSVNAQVQGIRDFTVEFYANPEYPMDPSLVVYSFRPL